MYIVTKKVYSLTCSLLGINKLGIMLLEVNSFPAYDCTEDFTIMFLVKDNWWLLFT